MRSQGLLGSWVESPPTASVQSHMDRVVEMSGIHMFGKRVCFVGNTEVMIWQSWATFREEFLLLGIFFEAYQD
jgi:hypothetical protein